MLNAITSSVVISITAFNNHRTANFHLILNNLSLLRFEHYMTRKNRKCLVEFASLNEILLIFGNLRFYNVEIFFWNLMSNSLRSRNLLDFLRIIKRSPACGMKRWIATVKYDLATQGSSGISVEQQFEFGLRNTRMLAVRWIQWVKKLTGRTRKLPTGRIYEILRGKLYLHGMHMSSAVTHWVWFIQKSFGEIVSKIYNAI